MWYVLQVNTGQEIAVCNALKDIIGIQALAPQENRLIHKGGEWVQKEYTLFPGYVFASLEYTAEHYYQLKNVPHVLRLLGPTERIPSPLTDSEVEWIRLLAGTNGQPLQPTRIRKLPNGGFEVVDGVLSRFISRTIAYDKRAHRAKLELSICGESKTVQLSVKLVNDS